MPDKRRGTTKSTEGAQQPGWKQPPPRKRKKVPTNQKLSLRARLSKLERSLTEPRSRPKTAKATARKRAAVHAPWRRLVLLPLAVALAFALLQFFTRDQFYIYSAQVRGNERVPADQIYAASQIDGQHIFWIRPNQAAAQVRELSGIADARVSMALPNKVTIEVQEREPLVAVQTISTTTWFAADGTPLPEVGSAPPLLLVDPKGAAGNGQGGLRLQVLADIRALHARLPDLISVNFGAQEGLTFRSPDGFTVYLGNQGNIATKLDLLQAVRGQIASRKTPPKVVDLRVDGNAYLR